MTSISYVPTPQERPYYEGLFQAADVQRSGNIAGGPAVQFFSRSKLPIEVLKNIWTVADQPSTSSLDRKKFAVAIRLIQLTQNGKKGEGPNLQVADGVILRPAMFEGVSGVTVQLPPPPGQQPPQQQQQQPLSPQQQQQQQQQQQPPQQQQQPPQQQRPPQQQQQPPQQQQQQPPQQSPPKQQQPQQQQRPPQYQQQQQQHQMSQQMQPPQTPAGQRPSIQQPVQQSAPPTPMRPGMPPSTPSTSRALVGQDPYAMTPQERSRYEALFPQYAKPDGFIYGKEAVELFMKSGVDQRVLRDIWNMVDKPIDNRLDKLEFAMAMHLIVCVSKKALPHPTAGLPNSLKALKAANQGVPPTPSAQQRPSIQQSPVPQQVVAPPTPVSHAPPRLPSPPPMQAGGGIPSPTAQRRSFQPDSMQGYGHQPPPSMSMNPSTSFDQPLQAAAMSPPRQVPPVVATSGLSISDAFEGLSTTSGDVHQSALPSYVPEHTRTRDYAAPAAVPEEYSSVPAPAIQTPSPAPVYETRAPQPQPQALRSAAASYDMGDANEELVKLKGVLQKLQAENISLKAQLGTMSEEEKSVQKEIGATVAEISKLSNELTTLRGEVLAAKSRLLEASAQLKSAREKKAALTEHIAEATSTKEAINEAYSSIENAGTSAYHAEHQAVEQKKNQAVRQSDIFESNLFGGDFSAPVPAPAPAFQFDSQQYQQQPYPQQIQKTRSYDTMDSHHQSGAGSVASGSYVNQRQAGAGSVASGSVANQSAPAPFQEMSRDLPIVQTVSSDEENEDGGAGDDEDDGVELFNNEFDQPNPEPNDEDSENGQGEQQQQQKNQNQQAPFQQQFAQPPQQQQQQYSYPPNQQQFAQPPPSQQYAQPPAQPVKKFDDKSKRHHRLGSGFASDFVMGGAAIPLNEEPGQSAVSPAARSYSDSSAYGYDDDDEYKNVEELKKKAESARETASDAEAAHRKLVNEADELRQDADKAEAMARSLRAAADEKKKGTFGGGKKKKLLKDAEKAAADAAEIKKRFLAVQGQANDAQAVAMETKREADKLRDEAEKAEYEMAAKASMKDQEKSNPQPEPASAPAADPSSNGYGQPYAPQQNFGYGQPMGPSGQPYMPQQNGYGQPPAASEQQYPPQQNYGFGQQLPMYGGGMPPPSELGYGGGFAAGVMGGGGDKGFDLPSPNQMTQPGSDYMNPFG